MIDVKPGARLASSSLAPLLAALAALAVLAAGAPCAAEAPAAADVVVVVDTSVSMRERGMDPERTSLLVTQLLADLVPGELAVVRLLDLVDDADVLPRRDTGRREPCHEDPSRMCGVVEPVGDWGALAREQALGVLERPARADEGFADALEGHLEQRIDNSDFGLAFRAAQGVLERHRRAGRDLPQTVVWLSDGRSHDEATARAVLAQLREAGVAVEAVVFGRGETELAESAGLEPRRVSGPAEMMRAFAGALRRIVGAPYEIDARVADAPSFTMQPAVDEAWVVVYGDGDLGAVHVELPGGERRPADHAARRREGAGAYRVAHLRRPAAGRYTVHAEGGGPDVAYAVVQRSSLAPRLVEPASAVAGIDTTVVAEVVAGRDGARVSDPGVLGEATITVEVVDGAGTAGTVELARRGDGRFAGEVRFRAGGRAVVRLHLSSPVVDRAVEVPVEVTGALRWRVAEVEVDLGVLGLGDEVCRPLPLDAEQQGRAAVALEAVRRAPAGHRLFLRRAGDARPWTPGETRELEPGEPVRVCLGVGERAPSSTSAGRPWLELAAASGGDALTCRLRWTVEGLGFWARWGWLVLTVLGLVLLAAVVAGFVVPHRFPPSLALVFVDDRDEVDEQQAQPLRQWRGVRIGFYRHARAHLHTSFRVSGRARGALATLVAERGGARVVPVKGHALARETLDGEWEPVPAEGRRARGGDVYRVDGAGPFFRIAFRTGGGA